MAGYSELLKNKKTLNKILFNTKINVTKIFDSLNKDK